MINRQLADMNRIQLKDIAPYSLAVLPTCSIEQHGTHLPLSTDGLLCNAVIAKAAGLASPGSSSRKEIILAPALYYGDSHHHHPFPGVLSLTSSSYTRTVKEICEGISQSGFQRLAIINGHGGNESCNNIVIRELAYNYKNEMTISAISYWDIARTALLAETNLSNRLIPGHAGQFETSLMLALRPELVETTAIKKLKKGSDTTGGRYKELPSHILDQVHVSGAWETGVGYTDNPSLSTAEAGHQYFEIITRELAEFFIALTAR